MKLANVSKMLGGSLIVYVVVAACSGATGSDATGADGGTSLLDAFSLDVFNLDALTDPVREASAEPTGSGSRLKAKYLAGADGSKQFLFEWRDTQRNEDCKFVTVPDGKTYCLPDAPAPRYFADANCTQPLIVDNGCAAQQYVAQTASVGGGGRDACAPPATTAVRLHAKGPAFVVPGTGIIYGKATPGSTCQSQAAPSGTLFTAPEVTYSAFVEATIAVEP